MRKLLGFLLAAVFVATVASNAMAITLSTATAGANIAKFRAEIVFLNLTGMAQFDFQLYKMTGVKPSTSGASVDASTNTIDWMGIAGITPGIDAFVDSKVYAYINSKVDTPDTYVYFYTDNSADTTPGNATYKYASLTPGADITAPAYDPFSHKTINALVEKNATNFAMTGVNSLPLAYQVTMATVTNATVGQVTVADGTGKVDKDKTFYVVDKVQQERWDSVKYPNKEDDIDYAAPSQFVLTQTEGYSTIASPEGVRTYIQASGANGYNGTASEYYFFFASNFNNARKGYSYGTNTLTVELYVK